MNESTEHRAGVVQYSLNGRNIAALAGESILQSAERSGILIPRLCYLDGYRPDGNCRACMVEIQGERVLAPACTRRPAAGMIVRSDSERALHSQKLVLELLLSDMPAQGRSPYSRRSELDHWADRLEVGRPRFPGRAAPQADPSNPAIAVNLDACIQCTRCVRACREEQVNDVIGYAFRGEHSRIVFDLDDPMGDSTCVSCGECVQACPTGALMPAGAAAREIPDKRVDSVCPYCGVGCLLTFNLKNGRIVSVDGRDGPSNHRRLCVKGRYGFDYVHHPERLKKPLIRRSDCPKTPQLIPTAEV
ncbi:MAG: (2Fe-2S)-binding protein, partial [Gammaproteobacteria bacterium]|nr:(2Fe-2S)-binding protein [Gammaproteobacteria bacterium]